MWANKDSDAAMKFLEATHDWHSTWDGKNSALQVQMHVRTSPYSVSTIRMAC